LHRTPTLDFDIVLAGEVVLELEDDHEVTLAAGDIVVQNGTRHRWVNRGATEARIAAVTIGADQKLSA
jgi:quercetin dioxygenase-like cupin family protein